MGLWDSNPNGGWQTGGGGGWSSGSSGWSSGGGGGLWGRAPADARREEMLSAIRSYNQRTAPGVKLASPEGGGGNWFTNTLHDVENTLVGAPGGIYNLVGGLTHDTAAFANPVNWLGFAAQRNVPRSQLWDKVAHPLAEQEKYQWGPLAPWDFHPGTFAERFHAHPLGPILDLAALASLGAGSAAKLGRLAEAGRTLEAPSAAERIAADLPGADRAIRHAQYIDAPRQGFLQVPDPLHVLSDAPDVPLYRRTGAGHRDFELVSDQRELRRLADKGEPLYEAFSRRKSMSPLGRLFDRTVDRAGLARPDAPMFGNVGRARSSFAREGRWSGAELAAQRRGFLRTLLPLTKDELAAYHLAMESGPKGAGGVPAAFMDAWDEYKTVETGIREDPFTGEQVKVELPKGQTHALRSYMESLVGKPMRQIEAEMAQGVKPWEGTPIDTLLRSEPRPEFLRALEAGRHLNQVGGDLYEQLGLLGPEARQARKMLAPRVRSGARYYEGQIIPVEKFHPNEAVRTELARAAKPINRELRQLDNRMAQANNQAARYSEMRARYDRPEPPEFAAAQAAREAADQAEAELRTARERFQTPEEFQGRSLDEHMATLDDQLAAAEQRMQVADAAQQLVPKGMHVPDEVAHESEMAARQLRDARQAIADAKQRAKEVRADPVAAAGRQLKGAQATLRRASAEVKRLTNRIAFVERKMREWKTQEARIVDHSKKSYRRSLSRSELYRRERGELLPALRDAKRVETEAKDAVTVAERTRDEAHRQAEAIAGRERHLVAAQRSERQALRAADRAERKYRRDRKVYAEAQRRIDNANAEARAVAARQRVLQTQLDEAQARARDVQMAHDEAGRGRAGGLTSARRESRYGNEYAGQVRTPAEGMWEPRGARGEPTAAQLGEQGDLGVEQPRNIEMPAGFYGGRTIEELETSRWLEMQGLEEYDVHPAYGMPDRFVHAGEEGTVSRAIASVQKANIPLRPMRLPGNARLNRAIRLVTARFATHPTMMGKDFARTFGYAMLRDQRAWLSRRSSRLLMTGDGLREGHVYFFQQDGVRVPRMVRESEQLQRDRISATTGEAAREIEKLSKDAVWGGNSRIPVPDWLSKHFVEGDTELDMLRKMDELGVRQVAYKDAKRMLREAKAADGVIRQWHDRFMDVWRALVLPLRPAWLVYNIVGQHMLYALTYAGPAGARSYLDALRLEKMQEDGRDIPLAKMKAIAVARRQSKLASMIEDLQQGFSMATVGRVEQRSNLAAWEGDTAMQQRLESVRKGAWKHPGKLPLEALNAGVQTVGMFKDLMSELNLRVADDLPRRAAFLTEAKRSAAIARIRRWAKDTEGVNLSLEQALRRADRATIRELMDNVDRSLGNFLDMGPIERNYIRLVVPFYSWFKVITRITARFFVDHPVRAAMLNKMVVAAGSNPNAWMAGLMPSYFAAGIPGGDPERGYQTGFSTASINPLATPVQLAGAAEALLPIYHENPEGQPLVTPIGTESPFQLLSPLVGMTFAAAGRDPFYGSDYQGPGAGRGPIAQGLGYYSNLPQIRLGEQMGWWGNYHSKLYDPNARTGHINNYILNYLGIPVKRVDLSEARSRAEAGQ